MAQVRFDINKAFKEVFGLYGRVPLFPIAQSGHGSGESGGEFPDAQQLEQGEESFNQREYRSEFVENLHGELMIDRFQFRHPDFGSYNLSPYTLLEISRAKNIVKTPLLGRNGTVKEFISMDDWQLSFKGFLINEERDELPYTQTARLLEVFGVNQHVNFFSEVVRRWFERQGVVAEGEALDFIVIEEVKLPPIDGFANVQPFEITAVSDNPIEIELLTNA